MSSGRSLEAEWAVTRLSAARGRNAPFLSGEERNAAERLRAEFTRAMMMPSVTQRWDATPRQSGVRAKADLSDNAIDARRKVGEAMSAVGPELSGLILDVCCHLKGLELVERERQWPARSAKMLLKVGLGMLARHYGFTQCENEALSGAPIRRWRAPDARPVIGG